MMVVVVWKSRLMFLSILYIQRVSHPALFHLPAPPPSWKPSSAYSDFRVPSFSEARSFTESVVVLLALCVCVLVFFGHNSFRLKPIRLLGVISERDQVDVTLPEIDRRT